MKCLYSVCHHIDLIKGYCNYIKLIHLSCRTFFITVELPLSIWGHRGRDRMVVGSYLYNQSYHHWCCKFESQSGRGVQHYVKVCQWLATGRWFSPGPPVSATNKTDCHDITEILLKVALNTIKQNNK